MDDLRRRFGSLDRLPAPDLWTEIQSRAMAFDSAGYAVIGVRRPTARTGRRRSTFVVLAAAALLLALLAGLTILIGALLRDSQRTLPLEGTFIPAGPMAFPRVGEDVLAVALSDGRVLIMGGHIDSNEAPDVKKAEIFDPRTGVFTATGAMREAHGMMTSTTLLADGRVLIVGGWHPTETGVRPVGPEIYDPRTGEFTGTGPMAMDRYGHTATLLDDGRVLIAGGDVSLAGHGSARPPAELFDPGSNTFTAIGPLAMDRLYHTATRMKDGRVLIAGGSGTPGGVAEVFDPETATFTPVGALAHDRRSNHSATLLDDGRVLVIGGEGVDEAGRGTLRSAEWFDPANGTFNETGSLISYRSGHDAVRLSDGRVFITGGYNFDGAPRSTEIFDPATGRFSLGGLAERMGRRSAALLPDGRVLVVGGEVSPPVTSSPAPMAEIFDATTTSTVTVGSRTTSEDPFQSVVRIDERFGQSATVLADGRVLIAGGAELSVDDFWGRPLASALIYDPSNGAVTETGPLNEPRAFHTATRLPDGRVLIAGGDGLGRTTDDPNSRFEPLASVEVYDPATGTFAEAAPMNTARGPSYRPMSEIERHLALLLTDGRVLFAGGVTGRSAPQAAVIEIYDPASGTSANLPASCPAGLGSSGVGQALDDGRALLACDESAIVVDPVAQPIARTPAEWQAGWGVAAAGKVMLTAGDSGPVVLVDPTTRRASASDWGTGRRPLSEELGSGALVQAVVRLPDGRVLVVGRSYEEATRGMAAIIDPTSGDITRLQPLAARSWPVVTVLDDGRVLITGRPLGSPDHFEPRPPNAELLDPSRVP